MSDGVRIAVFGDVNLNVIDGSSVWVQNVARVAAAVPSNTVRVYSRMELTRPELLETLYSRPNIDVIAPAAPPSTDAESANPPCWTLAQVAERIAEDDRADRLDAIVVRGLKAAQMFVKVFAKSPRLAARLWLYLTDIPQHSAALSDRYVQDLQKLAANCRYVLCQTEALRQFWETGIGVSGRKLLLLPPLVDDRYFVPLREFTTSPLPLRLVYSGKFAPLWGIHEQLDAFTRLRQDGIATEFHIIGDKFHNDHNNPAFAVDLRARIRETPGVVWYGGLPQGAVFAVQQTCHVGMALRSNAMNTSLELSTKLLEYGASGLAAITNPTPLHRELLGADYPLFADNAEEAYTVLAAALAEPARLALAAKRLRALAERHSFSTFVPQWERYMARISYPPTRQIKRRKHVVLAGHDLKFCKELIEYLESRHDITLQIDAWTTLRDHNEAASRKLLQWADVVICEWCAGNAVWYSEHVHPDRQKLLIRFHRFEINSEFPPRLRMENVHRVLFVSEHIRRAALAKFAWNEKQTLVVPNFVDTTIYDRPKFPGAEFNLGLIGYVPMLKRIDRAVDVLEGLLQHDNRYRLFVKGRHPWSYSWIWKKPEERAYYEAVFERLHRSPELRDHVIFDGFGDDVPAWLRKIGFILSPSDIESFHMAVAEGLASGAVPILWKRDGVEEVFPGVAIVDSNEAALQIVRAHASANIWAQDVETRKRTVASYDIDVVRAQYEQLI